MTATADSIIERRRLRKRLAFWRILAILAVLALVLSLVPWRGAKERAPYIARIDVSGLIVTDQDRLDALERIAKDDKIAALLVRVESPGGTVVGSEALYDAIRDVAAEKPVVALLGEAAASGGYITALAADRIVSRRNSITGSIGVIASIPDATELLQKIGVSFTSIKSSEFKASPNPFEPHDPRAVEAREALLADSYVWFRGLVGARRGLEGPALDTVADGRVFSGAQALDLGLVDALGDEGDALAWLRAERGIADTLEVRDYRWTRSELPFPFDQLGLDLGAVMGHATMGLAPGPRLLALYTG